MLNIIPLIFGLIFIIWGLITMISVTISFELSSISDISLAIFCMGIMLFVLLYFLTMEILVITKKRVKISKFPYLKKLYQIALIPYNVKIIIENFNVPNSYYFRDLPCDNDLLLAYFICYLYKITDDPQDFVGAVILKLIKDNNITDIPQNKNGYFLDLTLIKKCDYEYENMLLNILKMASVNNILCEKDSKVWIENNYREISEWYRYSLQYEEEKLLSLNLLHKQRTTWNLYTRKNYALVPTKELNEMATNIVGFKNYLLNFSLIKEKQIIDVKLWEYYLIYSKMLGIADKIEKQFNDIYPDLINIFKNIRVTIGKSKDDYIVR